MASFSEHQKKGYRSGKHAREGVCLCVGYGCEVSIRIQVSQENKK